MVRSLLQRASILALAVLLIGPTALAQSQNERPDDVPTEELEQVAEVLLQIEEVRQTYQKKIQEAGDNQDEVRSYQKQMKAEIDRAAENVDGITTERFDEITRTAQSDQQLKQKILLLVEEKRSKQTAR